MPKTMINNTIITILHKLVNKQPLEQEEQVLLDSWLAGSVHKEGLLDELRNDDKLFEELKKRYAFNSTDEWQKMLQKLRTDYPVGRMSDEGSRPLMPLASEPSSPLAGASNPGAEQIAIPVHRV